MKNLSKTKSERKKRCLGDSKTCAEKKINKSKHKTAEKETAAEHERGAISTRHKKNISAVSTTYASQ